MSLRDLLAVYGVIGIACAIAVLRRGQATGASAVTSALATVLVWPLWAPFALGSAPARVARPRSGQQDPGPVRRIERALAEAVDAVAGTPMRLLSSSRTGAV